MEDNQTKVFGISIILFILISSISIQDVIAEKNNNPNDKFMITLDANQTLQDISSFKIDGVDPYPGISQKISRQFLKTFDIPPVSFSQTEPGFFIKTPVYIYLDSSESITNLPSNIEILAKAGKIAAAKLTLNEMNDLSQLDSVERIGVPHMAEFFSHDVSEGVSFSMADNFHSVGIDGTGVTVAIIDGGFYPTNSEIAGNVISSTLFDAFNFCNGDIACGDPSGDSHGTAVAEVVVDESPGVSLRLYTIATNVDYNNAVDDAIANGVDIITASLGFPTLGSDGVGPNAQYFRAGTSDVAKKMNFAYNNGIFGTISAGNNGDSHWMGTYVPSATVSLNGYQSVMEFQPNENGRKKACLPFTNNGWRVIAAWNDAINENNDYDLFIFRSNMRSLIS